MAYSESGRLWENEQKQDPRGQIHHSVIDQMRRVRGYVLRQFPTGIIYTSIFCETYEIYEMK